MGTASVNSRTDVVEDLDTPMKAEVGSETECSAQLKESEPGSSDPPRLESNGSDWLDHGYVPRVRPDEANGFAVYTRSRRLKGRIDCSNNLLGSSGISVKANDAVSAIDEVVVRGVDGVNVGGREDSLGTSVVRGGEGVMEIEVKEETTGNRSDGPRRFTRSVLKLKDEKLEVENENSTDLGDTVVLEMDELESEKDQLLGSPKSRKLEMKMSKKILIKARPTTVRELFETGLLEGYPVFYNGGKRGFPLRGTIKDAGILCSCSLCKGTRVVPPCQFEIHACKSYRRASQYICLENGKSLLDVVKECRKSSVKTLEETIQHYIGPMPVKESVICRNCEGSFLATSAAKVEQLCDSCMIVMNSEVDAENVKSRPLEPLLGLVISENCESPNTPPKKGRRGRKRKHSELTSSTKSPGRPSLRVATKKKGQRKITKMKSQPASAMKSPRRSPVRSSKSSSDSDANMSASLQGIRKKKTARKILKNLSSATSLKSLEVESPSVSVQSKSSSKITKKDQRMHRLVFEDGGLPDGTEVAYFSNGKRLRDGYKMGSGIICGCCRTLVSPSQFEAHAGWASRRKPYMYIYTSDGVSLHEFAISLLKGTGRKRAVNDNDDLCSICADGGKLVLCDGCPRSFHKECASLSSIPGGKWFCTYCITKFERESYVKRNDNAVAAGRISGTDPLKQIADRCLRTVKNPEEAELIACVICRGYDFSKSGFGPRTVILCDQCEKEYHVGCLKKNKLADLKELPKGKWFCSENCKRIYSALQNLLNAGAEKLPDSSLDVIKKKQSLDGVDADDNGDVRWRLLNGKIRSRETRVLLSQAVAIFHDSFAPIVDPETGRDFIPSLVYGRNIRGQDFGGMYCAILTVNSVVVSAGILRIFGQDVAELPLAATRKNNQGQGYFQVLFSCMEKLLAFLNVKSFVLPSTDEAAAIWTQKFRFERIPQEQLLNYRKICWQMITFKGTSMLEKAVPKCRIINTEEGDPDVDDSMQ